ncbi:MAG: citrate synthase [Deferrisomatales bacterium]
MLHPEDSRVVVRGLEGVVAAETKISYVDGANGELFYQGYNIHDLAERVAFEEVIHLLWTGELPTAGQLSELRRRLVGAMHLPSQVIKAIELTPPGAHPMSVLRTAVSMLGMFDPDSDSGTDGSNVRKGTRLCAQVPAIVASLHRVRKGLPILSPDPKLSLSGNFLYMMHGRAPDADEQRAIDLLMVLLADHGLNASTFAARVVSSTLSDLHSAVAAAVGALKGPLHGGANQRVMEMLLEIDNEGEVEAYIQGMLDDKKRIMGFGHRVYKVEDPRTRHLKKFSEILCRRADLGEFYRLSHRIEEVVRDKKGIYPNVDFYAATVQYALGIPHDHFTAVFAAARTPGWVAHVLEQYADNRLIRPTSKYVGPLKREFLPLEERRDREATAHETLAGAAS